MLVSLYLVNFKKVIKLNPINNRLPEFDIAKGIAILCVILGHLGNNNINRVVFVFHMPIFFLISGYFLSQSGTYKEFVTKKFKQCMVPYIATCIAICVLSVPVSYFLHQDIMQNLFKWFCGSIYGSGTRPGIFPGIPSFIGALWFLEALFWGSLIVRYVNENYSNTVSKAIIIIVAYIGYATAIKVWLPFNIQAGCTAAGFIYLGYLYKNECGTIKTLPWPVLLSLIAIVTWCIKYFKGFWLVSNYFGNGFMDIIGACSASYLILLACKKIIVKNAGIPNILQWYGKNSLVVLAFHIIELDLIPAAIILQKLKSFGISAFLSMLILIIIKIIWASMGIVIVHHIPFLKRIFFTNSQ